MSTATLTDAELALRLARALGWRECQPPNLCWTDGTTHALPDWLLPWLLTGDGMLAVLEAMRERGWSYGLGTVNDGGHCAEFWRPETDLLDFYEVEHCAPILPRAVAEAALAALEAA